MYAAASGDSQFVSKLIVAGANINMTNEVINLVCHVCSCILPVEGISSS